MDSRESLDPRLYVWMREWQLAGYHTKVFSTGDIFVSPQPYGSLLWVEVRQKKGAEGWTVLTFKWGAEGEGAGGEKGLSYDDLDTALDAAGEFLRGQKI